MKKQPKIRLAVVGCGAVAAIHHLPAIAASDLVEAAVLVDADEKRARTLAERWGVPTVLTDYREAVGRVDAAVVAVPNHLHAPVAGDLLRRGVHVLVEKPMALTGAECGAMIEAAEAGRAVLAVGLEFRFFDSTRFVRDLLASEVIGPLRRFELRQGVSSRWPFATDFLLRKEMSGGGVLMDFGVHVLDLLLAWLGDWESVRYRDDAMGGVESDCEIELTMRSGLTGFVEISRTRNLANTCRFEGEKGTLEVGIWDPDPEIALRLDGQEMLLSGRARARGTTGRAKGGGLEFGSSFVRQVDDFAAAIREGREPRVSGREGRRSMDLIDACYAVREPLELPWMNPPQLLEAGA
ncbi:MAG TPA: Gfo/Idh/MocA family oxidoreductase [Thermoanaerobaculia bacterium]|nr:Gfo/Idh/MocA family oxidoreductase [Thermoanaerobaculia bacterium]